MRNVLETECIAEVVDSERLQPVAAGEQGEHRDGDGEAVLRRRRSERERRAQRGGLLLGEPLGEVEERADDLDARRRALDFCLEKLPAEARGIVEGCYASGSTIRSFAEQAGETANKIYKRLNRIRAGLQKCVERQLGLEEATQ